MMFWLTTLLLRILFSVYFPLATAGFIGALQYPAAAWCLAGIRGVIFFFFCENKLLTQNIIPN